MKRLFPTIKFVDDMPFHIYENDIINYETTTHVQTGHICYRSNSSKPFDIVVLKGEKQYKILLHELAHWLIFLLLKLRFDFLHILLDKYFTVKRKHTEREYKQMVERRRIWREKISRQLKN